MARHRLGLILLDSQPGIVRVSFMLADDAVLNYAQQFAIAFLGIPLKEALSLFREGKLSGKAEREMFLISVLLEKS